MTWDISLCKTIPFKKRQDRNCLTVQQLNGGVEIKTIYYIGADWLTPHQPVYIAPKLDHAKGQTNYLRMLIKALGYADAAKLTADLYEIKFDQELIEIEQEKDLLTPLLVIHFLSLVREIVKKGLKKSYYKVDQNLYARIKGKVQVAKTIKQNILKNKSLNTCCAFDEFGLNGFENRLLKKALVFVQRYLPSVTNLDAKKYTAEVFSYILPAFDSISDDVNLNDVKHPKTNVFYKEYGEAIRLAKEILKRFGYNITNAQSQKTIKTPPFWIDMSKLFELYVLGLLKDRFKEKVKYHTFTSGNELDYLLDAEENGIHYQMVIDAKYRPLYANDYDIVDIRQVSGYARLANVYKKLGKPDNELIDCLIIYPDMVKGHLTLTELKSIRPDGEEFKIKQFVNFYKIPVVIPII